AFIFLAMIAQSQSDHFVYAVTDIQKQGANWSFLRKLNLQSGEYGQIILNGADASQLAYDAVTNKQIESFSRVANNGYSTQPAFSSGVAALAYDKKKNRIYYTPMFIDQLRYIDLKTMKVYYVIDQPLTGMPTKSSDQGNLVTRMTIGNDGNVYTMTNDGTNLIRFSTRNKLIIENLGTLVDDPANKGLSIHNSCSSYGGDMIADNDGNLFIISARNNVFKVNIESKVATYEGVIKGLPATFTTNGAAVNDNNQIIISSAVDSSSYFIVNPKTWSATALKISGDVWRSSDLASSNILITKNTMAEKIETLPAIAGMENHKIRVFPNPVSDNQFTIQFSQLNTGNYTVQVTDVMGRQVVQRVVNVDGEEQTELIKLNPSNAKGIYLIKVTNQNNKSVFSKKIVVQ
ncbi:MAG TPA: T9SS type A sorting domain-containing protein, partial [Chitinophagaceae bacterium]|nr:T9SS type A sorting domain-containing protein [Chitinophagaceae bacterium]